jgi:hypothetical protein
MAGLRFAPRLRAGFGVTLISGARRVADERPGTFSLALTLCLRAAFRYPDDSNMIVHGFDMYRVFISTPGDLQREQDTCRAAISEVNAAEAMPQKILLVSVGLREDGQIEGARSAVGENVRLCTYYIQIFEDDWGPKNLFRKMFFLATDCLDDTNFPMRDVIVCLKDAPRETDPEILAFRKELQEQRNVRVFHFDKEETLKKHLSDTCSEWVRAISAAAAAG